MRPAQGRLRFGGTLQLDEQSAVGDAQVDESGRIGPLAPRDRCREVALHLECLLQVPELRGVGHQPGAHLVGAVAVALARSDEQREGFARGVAGADRATEVPARYVQRVEPGDDRRVARAQRPPKQRHRALDTGFDETGGNADGWAIYNFTDHAQMNAMALDRLGGITLVGRFQGTPDRDGFESGLFNPWAP